jgi:hypothetical protein
MSLDRIDNSKGHTMDNVLPACLRCNFMRADIPYVVWVKFIPALQEAERNGDFGDWFPKSAVKKFLKED